MKKKTVSVIQSEDYFNYSENDKIIQLRQK